MDRTPEVTCLARAMVLAEVACADMEWGDRLSKSQGKPPKIPK